MILSECRQKIENSFERIFSVNQLFTMGLLIILLLTGACNSEDKDEPTLAVTNAEIKSTEPPAASTGPITSTESALLAEAESEYTFHHVKGCLVCHGFTGSSGNLTYIRNIINTPNSGPKPVIFTARSGPNSFADGDETYDGPCEVCHTKNAHHNNDGHDLTTHLDGTTCTKCHLHGKQFAPPHKQSHQTHVLASQAKGPNIDCTDCHNDPLADPLIFADMKPLATTTVCDACHSPDGTYPGVDGLFNADIGAKANFKTGGIYNEDGLTLKPGKEKWCATCHDETAADIRGVSAPNIVGDESAATPYGTGYGFYKTGHGLPSSERYPASQSAGAGRLCTDCHDAGKRHIDGNARTYTADSDYLTYDPESANYQNGYRLKDIPSGYMGKYAMHIPRTGHVFPPGFRQDWEFALCFSCHDKNKIFSMTGSNFRDDGGGNWHNLHTSGLNGPFGPTTPQYDSDFDGIADSRISCVACHNVHGSPAPTMIRHGELISTPGTTDKVSALNLRYTPYTAPLLSESTGGTVGLLVGGPGAVSKNGVCNMCHNNTVTYVRSPIVQEAPSQPTNVLPASGAVNESLTPTLQASAFLDLKPTETHTASHWQITTSAGNYAAPVYDTGEMANLTSHTITTALSEGAVYFWRVRYKNSSGIWSGYSLETSFTTAGGSGGGGGTIQLTPSDVISAGYFTATGGTWATVLDSNDGDSSYAVMCCGAGIYNFSVNIDDPVGLTGATINSIKITVVARYLNGQWPNATPYAGGVSIDFKTGTNQKRVLSATTDTSGNYNTIVTSTIVADSDSGVLDVADLINLQIFIRRDVYGPPQLRVTSVWVDVDYTM